ncbi:MAG: SDR family NAD(P)-dependent oxidoreductase, partial [Betaproteobacteria bacterium]
MTLTSDHHNLLGDLSNQTVLITGAGNGIGRGAAHHLATLNARLVLTDNSSEALGETINSLPKPDSVHASIVSDLSTDEGASN